MSQIFQTIFYQPILNLLIFLYNIIPGHQMGLAIIVLTIIIRLVLWLPSHKAIKSQKALQEIQPHVNKLKEEHKDNKEAMSRALMNLYKEKGVNPFSSCLPVLVQLPFLLAVFYVFQDSLHADKLEKLYSFIARPETINTQFFGLVDLAQPSWGIAILAGLAQFFQARTMISQRKNCVADGSSQDKMTETMNQQMLYMMPVLTVVIGVTLPSGLSLYWLTTTLWTIGQQVYALKLAKSSKQ